MLFAPRIRNAELAALSRRLSISLASGVDIRKVWEREAAARGSPRMRRPLEQIRDAVRQGSTVSDAVALTGEYFPSLFRELLAAGEQTGNLAEIFKHLAEHYEFQIRLRNIFLRSITWPMLQLAAAAGVIGLLILIMGLIPAGPKGPRDPLGFGLVGVKGFVVYCVILAAVAGAIAFVIQATRRGLLWTRPIQRALPRIPGIGKPLETLALAQCAWTLYLTLEAGLSVLRAVPLALRSTGNATYFDHSDDVVRKLRAGDEIARALHETRAFPVEFLDAVEVGEQSGRLPEALASLARNYQEQAQRVMTAGAVVGGFVVWGLVALVIVFFIFRLASYYINILNGMVNDPMNFEI